MSNLNQVLVCLHPEQPEREQLHILAPKLSMIKSHIFYRMYKKYISTSDVIPSLDEVIEAIPEKQIHTALTRVRNELLMELM